MDNIDNVLIKAIRLNLEVLSDKDQKGAIAHFHKFSFEDMISWVYRNCKGCNDIHIIPAIRVEATFDDRVEIYTVEKVTVPDYYVGEQ